MRGVVAGGMVSAFEQLGLLRVFDAVYGSSAGATAGAYFVAGQATIGTSIFYENINNQKFLNFWRLFSSEPVMSIDFLIDHVMVHEKPLNWERIIDTPVHLHIVATDVDRGELVDLSRFEKASDIFEAMRASARMPLLAGPPVEIDGRRLMDGGVRDQIPLDVALQDGCSHVLALLTRPSGQLRGQPSLADKLLVAPLMRRISPELGDLYLQRAERYAATIERLRAAKESGSGPPYMMPITLAEEFEPIGRMEKRYVKLFEGAERAIRTVVRALYGDTPPPVMPTARVSPALAKT